jgi:hypothetical protein
MRDTREIAAEITFLTPEEGGRKWWPLDLSSARYRPHLVVGDSNQRHAVIRDGNVIDEEYLGVQFKPTDSCFKPGVAQVVILQLLYHPQVTYERLVSGATFTIREGAQVVGFGRVLQGREDAA